MVTAVVLSQGDEIITGQTVDTNASWISGRLVDLGVTVELRLTVGDEREAIARALTQAASVADVVVCTGGLGPTDDDLTAEACAQAFARPLQLHEPSLAVIASLFAAWGRDMPASNRKQALLPAGAQPLPNPVGTAPGFAFEGGRALVACLPGVPREMRRMFDEQVVPLLLARHALRPGRLVTLRTTGAGESLLQDRIGTFTHPGIALGYRTSEGENQIKLRAAPEVDEAELRALVADLTARVGSPVFAIEGLGEPGGELAEVVGRMLLVRAHTLAVAESCTGGRLAALCTAVPGASAWFHEGMITYANAAKVRQLGVPEALLQAHGAVSEPVARAMAEGARRAAGTTHALAVTGIAGPDGGTPDKPVGTVHVALASPDATHHRQLRLGGERARIQNISAHAALDLLRRALHGLLSAS